jgi:hypothetical protein
LKSKKWYYRKKKSEKNKKITRFWRCRYIYLLQHGSRYPEKMFLGRHLDSARHSSAFCFVMIWKFHRFKSQALFCVFAVQVCYISWSGPHQGPLILLLIWSCGPSIFSQSSLSVTCTTLHLKCRSCFGGLQNSALQPLFWGSTLKAMCFLAVGVLWSTGLEWKHVRRARSDEQSRVFGHRFLMIHWQLSGLEAHIDRYRNSPATEPHYCHRPVIMVADQTLHTPALPP